jgi:4-hydroxy-3-polyprenylbenzoate decarboxylase
MKGPVGKRPARVQAVRLIPSHPAPEPLSLSRPASGRHSSQHQELGCLTSTRLAPARFAPTRPVRFDGLRPFLRTLEEAGELHRVTVPVSARFEIAEIASRAAALDSPALLFEKVDGNPFPVVANLLAGRERIRLALGREPETIGLELMLAAERLQPPTIGALWETRSLFRRAFTAKVTTVDTARCHDVVADPDLDRLPILTCWPQDGGPFITWPMVLTQHPVTGGRNLGTYRMQVYDRRTTGLHMQIQKGGAFHYREAEARGQSLSACCILGGDPILMLASVAPLPENVDELAFAAFLRGAPLKAVRAVTVPILVPASADFVLEGIVPARERRSEGPFGDHFGHYSHQSEQPVFHLTKITHRHDAIFPVSVVGQPPQEDRWIGDALQEMLVPLLRMMHPEIRDAWAFPEAGFHNLLSVSVGARYAKESLKAAFAMLGTGQVSLSKVVVTVGPDVNARDPEAVLREIGAWFDPEEGFILLPGTAMDTLDFTSFRMNLGSKMILDACPSPGREPRPPLAETELPDLRDLHPAIRGQRLLAGSILAVTVEGTAGRSVLEQLLAEDARTAWPSLQRVPIIAVVSSDVRLQDRTHLIWGIFTRFDAARDILFNDSRRVGAAPVHRGTMGIDATWKPGYPDPVRPSEETRRLVDRRWGEYGLGK